jgi:hypothetical protein
MDQSTASRNLILAVMWSASVLWAGGTASGKAPVGSCATFEVLTWVAMGKSVWEIGEILAITKRTADAHARAAFLKLGAANRTHNVTHLAHDQSRGFSTSARRSRKRWKYPAIICHQ